MARAETDRSIKTISWACVGRRGQWLNRSEQSRGKTQPDRTADRLLRSGPGARERCLLRGAEDESRIP